MLRAHSISRVSASSVSVHLDARQMTSFRVVPLRFLHSQFCVCVCVYVYCLANSFTANTHSITYVDRLCIRISSYFVLLSVYMRLCEKKKK